MKSNTKNQQLKTGSKLRLTWSDSYGHQHSYTVTYLNGDDLGFYARSDNHGEIGYYCHQTMEVL